MRSLSRLAMAAVLGAFVGLLATPRPAYALFDSGAIVGAIGTAESALAGVVSDFQKLMNDVLGTINGTLGDGLTEITNHLKAQVGAQEQIANAQNLVQAQTLRSVRDAQLRDDFSPNREACVGLTGGESVIVAARNADDVGIALAKAKADRGAAEPGTPAWAGQSMAVQASNDKHFQKYCGPADADAKLCTQASNAADRNGDQQATAFFGPMTYGDQAAIDRANDYETNLIQPVAPTDVRGDMRSSSAGKAQLPFRRGYNAAMALAHYMANQILALHSQTVTLSATQKTEAAHEGYSVGDKASELEVAEMEVNRRYSGVQYETDLQRMPAGKQVEIEMIHLLAQQNWIHWQQYKLQQQQAAALAKLMAYAAEDHLRQPNTLEAPLAVGDSGVGSTQ